MTSTTGRGFGSADECQEAFYRAMREGDSALMRRAWLASAEAACIHPGAMPLVGYEAVTRSWSTILEASKGIQVRYEPRNRSAADRFVIHVGLEAIEMQDQGTVLVSVTNIYELTGKGWKIRLHHAAPVQGRAPQARPPLH